MRYWLIKLRNGATQSEVAKASGISQNYYSMIENGERKPSVSVAKRIGATLGFDWTLFFEDDIHIDVRRRKSVGETS